MCRRNHASAAAPPGFMLDPFFTASHTSPALWQNCLARVNEQPRARSACEVHQGSLYRVFTGWGWSLACEKVWNVAQESGNLSLERQKILSVWEHVFLDLNALHSRFLYFSRQVNGGIDANVYA